MTGRSDRIVVSGVAGGPDKVLSREVEGSRYELDRAGDVQAVNHGRAMLGSTAGNCGGWRSSPARSEHVRQAPGRGVGNR